MVIELHNMFLRYIIYLFYLTYFYHNLGELISHDDENNKKVKELGKNVEVQFHNVSL